MIRWFDESFPSFFTLSRTHRWDWIVPFSLIALHDLDLDLAFDATLVSHMYTNGTKPWLIFLFILPLLCSSVFFYSYSRTIIKYWTGILLGRPSKRPLWTTVSSQIIYQKGVNSVVSDELLTRRKYTFDVHQVKKRPGNFPSWELSTVESKKAK
jgi:hypothetical protein